MRLKLKYFLRQYWFLILAALLVFASSYHSSETVKWAGYAIGFAVISIGLGISSINFELKTTGKIEKMEETLSRIEDIQKEIQKGLSEQKGSSSQIVPTLQAFSQFYMDYINKQKGEDNK